MRLGSGHSKLQVPDTLTLVVQVLASAGDGASCSIIDFGLSYVSAMAEDKAVDLYVLERALESTHTQQGLMDKVLLGYKVCWVIHAPSTVSSECTAILTSTCGITWQVSKRVQATMAKLADVRMRGRKRVMVG